MRTALTPNSSSAVTTSPRTLWTVVALAAVCIAARQTVIGRPTPGEWSAYGADAGNTKYSALDQITASNAKDLRVAWRWTSPDNEIVRAHPGLHLNLFEATPVALDGNLFVATGLHEVASIDGRTGRTRWVYDPRLYERGTPQRLGFVHRGVALWPAGGRVFHATGDGYLVALDVRTGTPVATFGSEGRVDLLAGLRRPVERFQFGVNSPPIVVGDVVVVGSFVQDGWRSKTGPPGDVRGYDARTGRLRWTFHTVPDSGETGTDTWLNDSWKYTGSTNVWTIMSADEELGYVYLPTSTPTNDHYGGHRLGDNLFAESVVALDAKTGRRVWHFQAVHHGIWDYDLPAAPVLADVTIDGRRRRILAQVSKQAFAYVLDRETGVPIWPIAERSVPPSVVPGEVLSPTQPFPSRPAPFDRQGITVDDLIDFTPALRRDATEILNRFDYGPLYTPLSERGAVIMPGAVGGASWAGAGVDPETGWLYVPSVTNPYVMRVRALDAATSDMRYATWGSDRFALNGPDGLPLTKPPYGRITAIDLNTGEHKWVAPLGAGPRDHPALKSLDLPRLGWPSRGFVLITRTLLFAAQEPAISPRFSTTQNAFEFTAQTRAPYLSAFDKRTGQLLFELPLPANAGGSPMTFRAGSQQYVVVPVGGGGVRAELVAVSLGGR
jgi:quinoprotein glucose dehydrogenase